MKRIIGVTVLATSLMVAAVFASAGMAAPGKEDPSFGSARGHTITGSPRIATEVWIRDTLGLLDGSTISSEMVGNRAALTRRSPDGSPASTFGTQGTLLLPFVGDRKTSAELLATQGSSTIAMTSGQLGRSGNLYIQRFNSWTGKRDPGFGTKGITTLSIGKFLSKFSDADFVPVDMEIDLKKRIYVAAKMGYSPGQTVLIRLTANGKLDSSFWKGGVVQVFRRNCEEMVDMAVTRAGVFLASPDCIRLYEETGKLDEAFDYRPSGGSIRSLVTGPGGSIHLGITTGGDWISRIQRLNPDGSLDRSFGSDGTLFPSWPNPGFASLAIDEIGRLNLVGEDNSTDRFLSVARYTANGAPDTDFGGTGQITFDSAGPFDGTYPSPALIPGGMIVQGLSLQSGDSEVSFAKVLDNGTLDAGFGSGGVLPATAVAPPDDRVFETIPTASGGTLVAGTSGGEAALLRYLPTGRPDTSYGSGGWVKFRFGESNEGDQAIGLDRTADGETVVCVNTYPGTYVTKIDPDGDLDTEFGEEGMAEIADLVSCSGIAVTSQGDLLVGGTMNRSKPVVVRLKQDGTLEPSYGEGGMATGAWSVSRGNNRMAFVGFKNGNALIATPELMTKFGPDGQRVTQFGNGGVVKLTRSSTSSYSDPVTIRVTSNGTLFMGSNSSSAFMLLKIAANGEIIRNFGKDGLLEFKGSSGRVAMTDFQIQSDGKPVVTTTTSGGCVRIGTCYEKAFVNRFTRSGKLDRAFGKNGTFGSRYGVSSRSTSLILTAKGIVVGGFAETSSGREEAMLIRLKG